MQREGVLDLDGPMPPSPRAVASPSTSGIVTERARMGSPSPAFLVGVVVLAGAVLSLGLVLSGFGAETEGERLARPLAWGLADLGLHAGRIVSAVAVSLTVACVAWAGRSLTRSDVGGLLAGSLVALDPALLAYGRLALPTALALALLAAALAFMLSPRSAAAWVGTVALAGAAFVDPRSLAWGPVLALMLVLRGHIYASPRHVAVAFLQAMALPALGAVAHLLVDGSAASIPACLAPPTWALATLHAAAAPGASIAALPNPVTWFAGLGAVLFLGVGGLLFGATRFRLARANGRAQIRLTAPYPAILGRGLWLLLLAAATWFALPQAFLLPFALAVALGVQDLGQDAPGFGLTLAAVLLAFAGVVLWGTWDAVTGFGSADGVADALRIVPWAELAEC